MPTHVRDLPISFAGNQRDITIIIFGYVPDSPMPNKNRTASNANKPFTKPVTAVNKDHHKTILIKTFRGPILSPSMPDGISNSAYASENAASTQPNCSLFSERSDLILTPTIEMQIRSR